MKELGVGLIGYKFMGKAHSNAFRQAPVFFPLKAKPVMRAICGRNKAAVAAAARQFGWDGYETDWRKLIKRADIDIVDVTSPSNVHRDMVIEACKAGKHVLCEKPLANSVDDAKAMLAAAKKAKVTHMVGFNYRRTPAIRLAKRLIDEGRIGRIFHWRAVYLQDWIVDPDFPIVWRLDKKVAGSGPLGDLAAHSIDTARFLVGELDSVVGMWETFVKERPAGGEMDGKLGATKGAKPAKKKAKVTVEDGVAFLTRFKNGAMGTFEATRFAPGRKNRNAFEINGEKGSLAFTFEDMNRLEFYDNTDPAHCMGFRNILVSEPGEHDYWEAWWPPGHTIGYEHTFIHEIVDFVNAVAGRKQITPDFADGLACCKVLTAVEESIKHKKWIKIR